MVIHLTKILSVEKWEASKNKKLVQLPNEDEAFIHFSTEDQLERILSKYWGGKDYVLLTIDPTKLPGRLVLEANPGGTTQYYHLYDGCIPMESVVSHELVFAK